MSNDFSFSFPGLGIDNIKLNTVAFSIFGKEVAWYGLILTFGFILSAYYCYRKLKKKGIVTDDFLDLAIYTIVFGVIGARVFYVLTTLSDYDSFLDMIAIWNGGLALYGGFIGGAVAAILVLRHKKMNIPLTFDALAPAMMLGQIIGRWGNFVNGECYGSTSLFEFFGKKFDITSLNSNNPFVMNILRDSKIIFAQPTFLYESVWNLIGFILINIFYKKKKYDGQIFLWYITWYGFGRMIIESLRTDSLYIGAFKASQLIGLVCFLIGLISLIVLKIKNRNTIGPLYINKEVKEDDNN